MRKIDVKKLDFGMYPEQFALLEKGDVVKGKRGDLRIIHKVTKIRGETYFISLSPLNGWRFSVPLITYGIGDARNFAPVKVKNEAIYALTYKKVVQGRKKILKAYKQAKIKELQALVNSL